MELTEVYHYDDLAYGKQRLPNGPILRKLPALVGPLPQRGKSK